MSTHDITPADLLARLDKTEWLDAGERNPVCGPMRLIEPGLYERLRELLRETLASHQSITTISVREQIMELEWFISQAQYFRMFPEMVPRLKATIDTLRRYETALREISEMTGEMNGKVAATTITIAMRAIAGPS